MDLFGTADPRPVHFVGIAGAGMRALAELFARRGVAVSGCDTSAGDVEDLARLGILVERGHSSSHSENVRALVVSSAIPRDHPELARARELGLPVVRRAEALGAATSGGELIGIAGTHGKTTTTVMTTEALRATGLSPTGVAGGRVASWNGNLSAGEGDLYVVEADEFDRSFLALRPTVAIVTNIEADHLDIYRDLDDIRSAFAEFASVANTIVLCADDAGSATLPVPNTAEVIRYGITSVDARLVASDIEAVDGRMTFSVRYDGKALGPVSLPAPGHHNVLNAMAAIGAGIALGAEREALLRGVGDFRGVERRFQRIGDCGGVTIVDDYAHHPTEIAATLAAARAAFPGRRIVAAFQPHLYSRTRDFCEQFAIALSAADTVYLADLYPAREAPVEGVSSALIANAMRANKVAPAWEGARDSVAAALHAGIHEGDVVITLGAGDITLAATELRDLLGAQS